MSRKEEVFFFSFFFFKILCEYSIYSFQIINVIKNGIFNTI